MKIKFMPLCRDSKRVTYAFEGEKITATIGDTSETYDLSILLEGDELVTQDVETILPEFAIISATRTNGEVIAVVKHFHSFTESPDRELVNPSWWGVNTDGTLSKIESQETIG